MLIEWDDKYCVGIDELDEQHKMLISLVNELGEAMRVGQGRDILSGIFDELIADTISHFEAEEKRFMQCRYPGRLAHALEHENLKMQVMKFRQSFNNGSEAISVPVMNFFKSWLTNHIMESDKQYAVFFNSQGNQ